MYEMELGRTREFGLDRMFKHYIAPTNTSITKYSEQQEEISKIHPFLNSSRLNHNARSVSHLSRLAIVTHDKMLYPSCDTSKEVLIHNRTTFRQMMGTMSQLEWSQYADKYKSIEAEKTRMNFYKRKTRRSVDRCIFLISLF